MSKFIILTPVFNDWDCFFKLCERINENFENQYLHIVAINDCSTHYKELEKDKLDTLTNIKKIQIIHLHSNLGHQRAIAVGLSEISNNKNYDFVIIMDSDGEDKPDEIIKLIELHDKNQEKIILAQRTQRSEGTIFKIFYSLYKIIFNILTGCKISFGNFSLIPFNKIKVLTYSSYIWNNLSATILRTKIEYILCPTNRGKRYFGTSHMNFTSLIIHGMQSISVFAETVIIRVALFVFILILIGINTIIYIKLNTNNLIPGYASEIIAILLLYVLQIFSAIALVTIIMFNTRGLRQIIPQKESSMFIDKIQTIK